MIAAWPFLLALSLEAASALAALARSSHPALPLAAHAGACLLVAAWARRALAARKTDCGAAGFLLLFITPLLFPALGLVAIGLLVWTGRSSGAAEGPFNEVPVSDLPCPDAPARVPRDGELRAILEGAADPARRRRAVLATRRLPSPRAVPLLNLALKDSVDEVRLLAHGMLLAREKSLYGGLQESLSALEQSPAAEAHLRVAQGYWEIAHHGLVRGRLAQRMLGRARAHAEIAATRSPSPAGLALLGRILLKCGKASAAGPTFRQAVHAGAAPARMAPWLAESAFAQRRFDEVRKHVLSVSHKSRGEPVLAAMVGYWS